MSNAISHVRAFAAVLALCVVLPVSDIEAASATQADNAIQKRHKGIFFQAWPAKSDADYDLELLSKQDGISNLIKAVDLVYETSPFSVKAIERLQANGRILVVYHPDFQAARNGLFTLAAFHPDFYKRDEPNGRKDFVVVVGRHGVKWPTRELAMILVHELVGHGIQHLNGWLDWVRELDLECNANLYAERFYQDVGIDKKSREVVEFRRGLESHWCSDFKIHMRKNWPQQLKLWDVLNPDVPKLLAIFDRYVADLRDSGVAQKAIGKAKAIREQEIREKVLKAAIAGDAAAQYEMGLRYREGMGVDVDQNKAAQWFLRSAHQGNARAQLNIGQMHLAGKGVKHDFNEAMKWLQKAAAQGDQTAARLVRKIRSALAEIESRKRRDRPQVKN